MSEGRVHAGRVPFRYQISEKDCTPTSILNGVSFLLDRKDVPSEVLRAVYTSTLDDPGGGTTPEGEIALMSRFTDIGRRHEKFRIHHDLLGPGFAYHLGRKPSDMPSLLDQLKRLAGARQCIVLRVTDGKMANGDYKYHSLLALNWDSECDMLEAFDPCLKGSFPKGGPNRVPNHGPQTCNLKIPSTWLTRADKNSSAVYHLPPKNDQTGVLLYTGTSPLV